MVEEKLKNQKKRIEERINALEKRMQIDSNDLEYELHLRQKRELTKILYHLQHKEE